MKAFITGGTGFIGSHLVESLIDHKDYDEIRCLVRNNEKWLKGKDYVKIKGDLDNLPVLKKAVKDVDVIFHLAGLVMAPTYQEFEHANVEATENLLRIALKQGIKKIVVLSSLAAAGPSQGRPITEDDPMHPISMYGKSKKQMEEMIHRTYPGDDTSITILRPPAVYGPREDQIYSFFKAVSNHICPIVGDGKHPRISLVYVADVIQGILKAAEHKEAGVNTYFITGEEIHTWNEIRGTTSKVLGKKTVPIYIKPKIVKKIAGLIEKTASFFGTYPVINKEKANEMIMEWTCKADKAEKELGYQPEYTLQEGLARTIHWYQLHHWL